VQNGLSGQRVDPTRLRFGLTMNKGRTQKRETELGFNFFLHIIKAVKDRSACSVADYLQPCRFDLPVDRNLSR
jgi:hypothetical protein